MQPLIPPLVQLPNQLELIPLPGEIICYHAGCTTVLTSEIVRRVKMHCDRKFINHKAFQNILGNTDNKDLKMTAAEITTFNNYANGITKHRITFSCRGCRREVTCEFVESTGQVDFPEKKYSITKTVIQKPIAVKSTALTTPQFQLCSNEDLRHFHTLWYPHAERPLLIMHSP